MWQVSWQVLVLGDGFGTTYDCGTNIISTEYCIHFISRVPTLDEEKITAMIEYAESLNLNPLDLEYDEVDQNNCW